MILFVVSIVVAMLAVGALALLRLLSTEHEATLLRGDEIQAAQLVDSGVELVSLVVDLPQTESKTAVQKQNLYDNPALFRGIEVVPAGLDRPQRGAGRFTVFAPKIENGRLSGARFGLVNESTRLHLGTVLQWEQESPGQGVRALMKLPGMTPAIADSILDWADADKTPRSSGAEFEYYERMGVAYRPRNAVPATLEELLLVRDMTRTSLFGIDESFSYGAKMSDLQQLQHSLAAQNDLLFADRPQPLPNTLPDTLPGEVPMETEASTEKMADEQTIAEQENAQNIAEGFFANLAGELSIPWCFLFTVVSAEKLVSPQGVAKLYLNESNLEFLEQQLKLYLDDESVAFILLWRKVHDTLESPIDLLDATLTEPDSQQERKSPFSLDNVTAEEKFLTLLDYATCQEEVVVTGRINVNEAPQVVLAAVPELTEEMVSQILASRNAINLQNPGRFRHPEWLLAEKIVDKAAMKKLSQRLTTGGDVYRAQVVGFFDGQGTVSRAEIVVDATVRPPRPIFRKDLTMFGSGFDP